MEWGLLATMLPTQAQIKTAVVTMVVIFVYFFINRKITQFRTKRRLTRELAHHDNFAYGLSYAGSIFAFVVIASDILNGLSFNDLMTDSLYAAVFAALAVMFLELGRYIHDNHILFSFDEGQAINQKNVAGAFVDNAAMIANAVCITAIYHWSGAQSYKDLPIMILMFCFCQIMLLMVARWREHQYAKANQGESMQRSLRHENLSMSIYYAGYLIAGALAIKTGSHLSSYQPDNVITNIIHFIVASFVVMLLTAVLSSIGSKIVLANIDSDIEISHQDNIGIATIEFVVTIAMALVLLKVF